MSSNSPIPDTLLEAVYDTDNVTGHTHNFYNYPARFSPVFVREAISAFTEKGDLILDPFVGGGTTLIEAKTLGRNSIGFDISSLATFLSNVKTTAISKAAQERLLLWANEFVPNLRCDSDYSRPEEWINEGYFRNMSEKDVWPLRVLMEKFIHKIENSPFSDKEANFLRAALLKTGQWALDSKSNIPIASSFRSKLLENINSMLISLETLREHNASFTLVRNKPAKKIASDVAFKKIGSPKLVLTSPPYPGVHVMYHRWQIHGRRETPLPFWIADSQDGHGLAHYTMGDRNQKDLTDYFKNIKESFSSIVKVCNAETVVIQVIGFSNASWQLPKYLEAMSEAGLEEINFFEDRLWRTVPNRRWYAQNLGNNSSSQELILFHRLKSSH